jgi:hypothetical protein
MRGTDGGNKQLRDDRPVGEAIALRIIRQTGTHQMWEIVSRHELNQAKQELRARRAATLNRQAEELQRLDAERREIEELSRLAATLSRKFGRSSALPEPRVLPEARVLAEPRIPPEPRVRWIVAPAAVLPTSGAPESLGMPVAREVASLNRLPDHRQRRVETFSGTNFDMFLRAVTASSF